LKKLLIKLAGFSLVALASFSASAATYSFDDVYTGTFVDVGTGPIVGTGHLDTTLTLLTANSADSLQYASGLFSQTFYDHATFCPVDCTFTATAKNGDHLFGTFAFTSLTTPDVNGVSTFAANTLFTGGDGLFTGATGTGSISGTNDWATLTATQFNLATITTPVPEADTSAMMLMGAGLMGFIARRRKVQKR